MNQELVKASGDVLTRALTFKIATPDQYRVAGDELKAIKALMQKIGETFDPIISKAHAAHKEAVAQRKAHEAPLIEAEDILKRGIVRFQIEQEQERRAQQARLEERARKERERLETRAEKAAEKGKDEKAAELRVQAQTVATPVLATTTPKLQGISTRETYKATVTSKARLIEAVVGGRRVIGDPDFKGHERRVHPKVQDAVLTYDQAVLNTMARALKTELNYPGVSVSIVQNIASSAA